jgi:hypothetical protein
MNAAHQRVEFYANREPRKFMAGHRNDYGHQLSRWIFFRNRYAADSARGNPIALRMFHATKSAG